MPDAPARFILYVMDTSTSRENRLCATCGTAVGTYEPAVFVLAHQIIRSSRAASPGLSARPDCRLSHKDCFDEHGGLLAERPAA